MKVKVWWLDNYNEWETAKLRHHKKRTINSKYNRVVAIAKNLLVRKDKICEWWWYDGDDDDDDDTNSHSQSFYKIASLKNFEDFTKKTCDGILVLLKIGSITGVSLQLLRSFSK